MRQEGRVKLVIIVCGIWIVGYSGVSRLVVDNGGRIVGFNLTGNTLEKVLLIAQYIRNVRNRIVRRRVRASNAIK